MGICGYWAILCSPLSNSIFERWKAHQEAGDMMNINTVLIVCLGALLVGCEVPPTLEERRAKNEKQDRLRYPIKEPALPTNVEGGRIYCSMYWDGCVFIPNSYIKGEEQ